MYVVMAVTTVVVQESGLLVSHADQSGSVLEVVFFVVVLDQSDQLGS